jgi:hypothetical protein
MPSISIFQAGLARPPTIRVLAGFAVAKRLAARLAGNGDIAMIRQNDGDLDEIIQGHPGSHQLCFEILPSKAALLDNVVRNCAVLSARPAH